MDDVKRDVLSGKTRPRASRPPSEEQRQVLLEFKEQHYATWPDIPLPALKGKTPRDAVRSKEGRAAVVKLLRSMEFDERRMGESDGPAYDFGKLRRALGLEEE